MNSSFLVKLLTLHIVFFLSIFAKEKVNGEDTKEVLCVDRNGTCVNKKDSKKCQVLMEELKCSDGEKCCKKGGAGSAIMKMVRGKGSCAQDSSCTDVGGQCISKKDNCQGEKNDALCGSKKCSCCIPEKDVIVTKENPMNLYCVNHPDMVFQGNCYFFSFFKANWHDAREECLRMGGNLAKINDDAEFSYIQSHITENTWIGMKCFEVSGNPLCYWDDGSIASINPSWWHTNQPSLGDEHCVGFWVNGPTLLNDFLGHYDKFKYVCEIEP